MRLGDVAPFRVYDGEGHRRRLILLFLTMIPSTSIGRRIEPSVRLLRTLHGGRQRPDDGLPIGRTKICAWIVVPSPSQRGDQRKCFGMEQSIQQRGQMSPGRRQGQPEVLRHRIHWNRNTLERRETKTFDETKKPGSGSRALNALAFSALTAAAVLGA